ncbi:MAG: DUF1501 domain-containing protein [Planctomycetia bacterium]
MSEFGASRGLTLCPGPGGRRHFLQAGLAGIGSLSLPGLLRLRAEQPAAASATPTAVIMVWLPGGCSHIDTYDPKPDATSEYRGPFRTIATKVPGLRFTELLPRQAALADRFTLVRSMAQTAAGHPAGSIQMLSGDMATQDKPKPKYPDWMCVTNYLRSKTAARTNPLPRYVGVNPPLEYNGPAYVGDAYQPFTVSGDPSQPTFTVPNLGLASAAEVERLGRKVSLRRQFDALQRAVDRRLETDALDAFEAQALELLTNPAAKEAFDLTREDDRTRDRYGRNAWGQQLLMARRLVEAGVEVVTTSLSGPLCGRVGNWDDHAVNHHIFDALTFRSEAYDQAVAALVEDVYERGLDKRVLVVVTGEFGRTPKIEYSPSTGAGNASAPAGTKQPGRDHWPRAFSNIWFGGGIRTGQVVGATDRRGEDVVERRCSAHDFLATIYHHLGIDASRTTIDDFSGRPTPIVDHGRPIPELVS